METSDEAWLGDELKYDLAFVAHDWAVERSAEFGVSNPAAVFVRSKQGSNEAWKRLLIRPPLVPPVLLFFGEDDNVQRPLVTDKSGCCTGGIAVNFEWATT